MFYRFVISGFCGFVLIACNSNIQNTVLPIPEIPQRQYDPDQLALGEKVYKNNCAKCHGINAQGEVVNWRQRGPDGRYPAPPLDGTAHSWHHSGEILDDIIRNGSPDENSKMPAWQGKLSDEEIAAVITWFQSKWPKKIYDKWYQMNQSEF